MKKLIKNISSLITLKEGNPEYRIGKELQNISEIKNGAIYFDEKIIWTGTSAEAELKLNKNEFTPAEILDYTGRTIMPGFVDSHSHIVFGGDRAIDFGKKLQGYSYKQIAEEGGGILNTVNGTRNATLDELVSKGEKLALEALAHGTTTTEIKSGYGLSTESEIKQLKAIQILKEKLPLKVISTFMGAHDFPPEFSNNREAYIDLLCNEMLPMVADLNLAEFCDAFVDEGYYTIDQGRRIFTRAKELGFKIRVHADEMACVNAAELAAEVGAYSADHLLFVSDEGINAMKNAGTVATMMPGTAYFIRMPYAPARKIIENGAITALASDCNPGSCYTQNMQLVMSLATINMKMTAEEAITASTINGAKALGISDSKGSLADGKDADFISIDSPSYIEMLYHFGVNHVKEVWIAGKKII